jgi:putative transcriptional regulator
MTTYKTDLLEAVHQTAAGLFRAGAIPQMTMREFDHLCLPPIVPLEPQQIKRLRQKARVSQAVFAALLNTSVSTIQKWEIGDKKPTGTALKLLHLVRTKGIEMMLSPVPIPRRLATKK